MSACTIVIFAIFFVSVLVYTWFVRQFPETEWYQYFYAMVALGVIALPLSFYLYLDPDHPWWKVFDFTLPGWLNPLPHWNRYQWFRLLLQVALDFATMYILRLCHQNTQLTL